MPKIVNSIDDITCPLVLVDMNFFLLVFNSISHSFAALTSILVLVASK